METEAGIIRRSIRVRDSSNSLVQGASTPDCLKGNDSTGACTKISPLVRCTATAHDSPCNMHASRKRPPSGTYSEVVTMESEEERKEEGQKEVEDCKPWIPRLLKFVHKYGEPLLQMVCSRYKLNYSGRLTSIPRNLHEQVSKACVPDTKIRIRACRAVSGFWFVSSKHRILTARSVRVVTVPCRMETHDDSQC